MLSEAKHLSENALAWLRGFAASEAAGLPAGATGATGSAPGEPARGTATR